MLLTVYKTPAVRYSVQLPADTDLTEFRQWASTHGIWYAISRHKNPNENNDLTDDEAK